MLAWDRRATMAAGRNRGAGRRRDGLKIQATHDLPCAARTFWDLYFDDDYNGGLDRELNLAENQVLERDDDGDITRMKVRVAPAREVPAAVRKVLPSATLAYNEHRVLDRRRGHLDWRVTHDAVGPKRLRCEGVLDVIPTGEESCRRVLDGEIKVRIPLVGRFIEKAIATDVVRCYDVAADFLPRWLERQR